MYQYILGESHDDQNSPTLFLQRHSIVCIWSGEAQIPPGCSAFSQPRSREVLVLSLSGNHQMHRGQKHALQSIWKTKVWAQTGRLVNSDFSDELMSVVQTWSGEFVVLWCYGHQIWILVLCILSWETETLHRLHHKGLIAHWQQLDKWLKLTREIHSCLCISLREAIKNKTLVPTRLWVQFFLQNVKYLVFIQSAWRNKVTNQGLCVQQNTKETQARIYQIKLSQ